MQIDIEKVGEIAVVTLQAEHLDASAAEEFKRTMQPILDAKRSAKLKTHIGSVCLKPFAKWIGYGRVVRWENTMCHSLNIDATRLDLLQEFQPIDRKLFNGNGQLIGVRFDWRA